MKLSDLPGHWWFEVERWETLYKVPQWTPRGSFDAFASARVKAEEDIAKGHDVRIIARMNQLEGRT